jgi:hypothetical protein
VDFGLNLPSKSIKSVKRVLYCQENASDFEFGHLIKLGLVSRGLLEKNLVQEIFPSNVQNDLG